MKLKRIYSDGKFKNTTFSPSFNVVLAEISDRSKTDTDTHNLGKTSLLHLVDFLLLKQWGKPQQKLLPKAQFTGQAFFLEILLNNGSFLVIRRSFDASTKISFRYSDVPLDGYDTELDWTLEELPFSKARAYLKELLAFDVAPSWSYRKGLPYFLRSQRDFQDVFRLDKFRGKDADWKPYVFEILGFNGQSLMRKYELEQRLDTIEKSLHLLETEANISLEERDKIVGLIDLKEADLESVTTAIDSFNFSVADKTINQQLIDEIDTRIQALNAHRYNLGYEISVVERSAKKNLPEIDLVNIKRLYEEIQIHFPDNLSQAYEKLIEFNRSITVERNRILQERLGRLNQELKEVEGNLAETEIRKANALSLLTDSSTYAKFKEYQKQLARLQGEIMALRERLHSIDQAAPLLMAEKELMRELEVVIKEIASAIAEHKHSEIRRLFNGIIREVLSTNALISIRQNRLGNVEFEAQIQRPADEQLTAEGSGNSYQKLLCMAFDIAILMHFSQHNFFRFAYHDGALEGLDDRKKINFIKLLRRICSEFDVQYIMTVLDSDLPKGTDGKTIPFLDQEICLTLHDRDDSGKLFLRSF